MPSFHASCTDAESHRLVISDAGVEHFVEAYGIRYLANTDKRAARFVELWAAISAIAPHR